ncbi:MAG: thioredoxin family protein [Bacteroidota bacterium]
MRSLFYFIIFCSFSPIASGQKNFIIHGKISLLSKSKSVIISSSSGQFTGPVKANGSFEITGIVKEPEFALIKTDSSGNDGIWLQAGEYTITCKEISMDGIRGYLFRMPGLKGPEDAAISYGIDQPQYYIRGTTDDETRQKHKDFAVHYIDSILRCCPATKTLPHILESSQHYIGDQATAAYRELLNPDQKKDPDSKSLDNYFKRKEKMEREKYFEGFSMSDNEEKNFTLASVKNKKLILLDFWSTDCYPCRKEHLALVELYKKYASRGLEIISISLDSDLAEWNASIQKDQLTWINVSELNGWENSLAKSYFINAIPFAVWLDGNRKIIGTALSEKQIEEYLK